MSFFVIGDADTVLGFRLIGIDGLEAEPGPMAERALAEALSRPGVRLLLITERLAEGLRDRIGDRLTKDLPPFVVEIPDRAGPLPTRRTATDLIRRSIGVAVTS